MKRSPAQLIATGLIGLALCGCAGYQLGSVKPAAYEGINKLHVPPFKNSTLEPRLSSLVTNAVLKEMQADGTYQVSTRSNADAVLVGEIRNVEKRQLRAVRTDTLRSQELRLYIVVDFHLEDPHTGARIETTAVRSLPGKDGVVEEETLRTRQGRVRGETIQFVDESFQVGERNALAVAAEDLAGRLVSLLANGW
ncbi:MAG: LptE family protein [Verrucomicrobiales bacterium]